MKQTSRHEYDFRERTGTSASSKNMIQYKIYLNGIPVYIVESNPIATSLTGDDLNPVALFTDKKQIQKIFSEIENNTSYQSATIFGLHAKQVKTQLFSDYKKIRAAGGVVINNQEEILMILRRGVWDLPKGKIEAGEKKRMAALREVREETGVKKLSILKKLQKTYHTYNTSDSKIIKVTHWYLMMSDVNGKLVPQKSESIELAEWVNKNQIQKKLENTFSSIKEVIAAAMLAAHPD